MALAVDVSQVEGVNMNKVGKIYSATISSSGQVTLPAEIRRILGVGKNETVNFEVNSDTVTIKRPMTWDEYFEEQKKWVEEEKKRNPAFAERLKRDAGKTANQLRDEWMASSEGQAYYKEKYGV